MVRSQQSAKQWATAIIRALMNICWDEWDFCNTQTHGKDSPMERKLHRRLNVRIRQEYVEGYAELLPIDKHWLRDQSYSKLKNSSIMEKERWLTTVCLACKDAQSNILTDPDRIRQKLLIHFFHIIGR